MDKKLKMILAAMALLTGMTKAEIEAKLAFDENTDDVAFKAAVDEVLDANAENVRKKKSLDFSEGHKKGKSETMTELEAQLKDKFPEVKSTAKGIALIEKIIADTTNASGDPAKIDEAAVKKHPAYLQLEKDSQKALEDAKTEGETKLKEVQEGIKKQGHLANFKKLAMAEFDKLNPILPENKEAAERRRAVFEKSLNDIPVEFDEKGNPTLINEKGDRLEDKQGHPVKLSDAVKGLADEHGFEYKAASDRSSGGLGNPDDKNKDKGEKDKDKAPKFTGAMPVKGDTKAYMAILNDDNVTDEAKTEVMTAWGEMNKET